jgi:hypothetical protein
MSGSGGYGFKNYTPEDIRAWIPQVQDESAQVEHRSRVNRVLSDLLAQYNDRNVELTRTRLDEIETALEDALDSSIDLRFGGSIAKRTYIDGLSDVDTLAILRDRDLASATAKDVLDLFAETLHRELGYDVDVREGQLAVTISYPDGMEIQVLPAVQTQSGVRIPSANSVQWSPIILPQAFAEKLTQRNRDCGNRLVPVIKLAKAILADLSGSTKPNGYHVESMAVEAFEGYSGPNNYKEMLQHFFQRASTIVLGPIQDKTGQSLNVDQDLGEPNSQSRRTLSGVLDRIARRMGNADRTGSSADWLAVIGETP